MRRIGKKVLVMAIIAGILAGLASAIICNASWEGAYIEKAQEEGWMVGTSKGFEPGREMTRAEIVTVLWRVAGEPAAIRVSFGDVDPKSYYAVAVGWARNEGIVEGVNENEFRPNDKVTREQFATILWRFAGEPEGNGSLAGFRDPNLTPWSEEAVRWAIGEGILNGVETNGFRYILPKEKLTRAQGCAMIVRYAA